jgi:hypothetical protein
MNNFEGIQGAKLDEYQSGDRADIKHEAGPYFDATLDKAVDALKSRGLYRLPDVVNRLDNNEKATKQRLAKVLNRTGVGYDWGILDTLSKNAETE